MRVETNFYTTPVYIVSFNRVEALSQLVSWLEGAGYTNIHIIDNASTYPPLIEYLQSSQHSVHRMDRNYGHLVLWDSGKFDDVIYSRNFVLSDCDILPDEQCPGNVIEQLAGILERFEDFTKVGLSLRLDDLPDHYELKQSVLEWEAPFWQHPIEPGVLYEAAVDTTFAYYRPGIKPSDPRWWRSIRTGPPLSARHLPWYSNTQQPTDEDLYYQANVLEMSSQWSVTDPRALKEQNIKLQAEVHRLRAEVEALREDVWHYYRVSLRAKLVSTIDKFGFGAPARALYRRIGQKWK